MPTLLINTNLGEMNSATSSHRNLDEFKHDLNELINKLIDNSEKVNMKPKKTFT